MDKKDLNDLFWVTFMGEYVQILTRSRYETPEGNQMQIQGYMLDMDERFYYIGDNALEVKAAICKQDVSFISVIEDKDPAMEMLEEWEPNESEETN